MTGIFKANNPYNNFLFFVYGLGLKLPLFLFPVDPFTQPLDGILYKLFIVNTADIASSVPVFYASITFFIYFLQAVSINKLVNDNRLHPKPNYLTGMSYLLITSMFPEWFSLSAPLVASSFLVWVWGRLSMLHNDQKPKATIFNIGLITATAGFFYWPVFAFSILIMGGLFIARPFRLAEWLMGLVGLCTPFYFFASWLFLSGKWRNYALPEIYVRIPRFSQTNLAYVAIVIIVFSMLIGLFFINQHLRKQVVQTRKSWQLLFLYLLVAATIPLFNTPYSINHFILTAIPLSFIIASSFYYPDKKWYPVIMHWSMVAISIIVGYFL